MATVNPLVVPPRRRGAIGFLRYYAPGLAWIPVMIALVGGGVWRITPAQAGLGLLLGCALGITCDWIDRVWHQVTGRPLRVWGRDLRERAHVVIPFLVMIGFLGLYTVLAQERLGVVATAVFVPFYFMVTDLPRHEHRAASPER